MNTTLLFAEILIIGLQAGIWLMFFLLNAFGVDWIQFLLTKGISDWQTAIVAMSISFFYALGIIVDRISDRLFHERRVRDKVFPNPPKFIGTLRFELSKDNDYLNRQFEYTRSRMRIARASSLNFGLITLFIALFIILRSQLAFTRVGWIYSFGVLIVGGIFTAMAIYTWRNLIETFYKLLKVNYELQESKQSKKAASKSSGVSK